MLHTIMLSRVIKIVQVTTHSHLLSHKELSQLEDVMQMNIVSFHLHEFETELDFCNKIGLVNNLFYNYVI